jgi:hypothetical protein
MPFKVSFKYTQQVRKNSGWSESFWCTSNNLPDARVAADELYILSLRLHAATSYVTHILFSEVGAFRQALLIETNRTANPESGSVADIPTSALLLRLRNAESNTYQTLQWIKGIPDAQINTGGFYLPSAGYAQSVNAFLAKLISGPWAMRVQDKTVPKKKILAIDQAGVVTLPAHGYDVAQQIRISRVQGYTAANGLWRILSKTTDTFTLANWTVPATPTPMFGQNMTAQLQSKIFVAIKADATQIIGATSHKVGRPFALATGRQTKR